LLLRSSFFRPGFLEAQEPEKVGVRIEHRHIGAKKVREVMKQLIGQHGAPRYIRSDNGPEFVAHLLREWLEKPKIKTLHIDPGSPWQNGYVETSGAR
jgi:transposase InsO family protein